MTSEKDEERTRLLEKSEILLRTLHEIVRSGDGISPFDIQKTTKMSYSSIHRAVRTLKKLGLVQQKVVGSRKGGEKHLYVPCPDAKAVTEAIRQKLIYLAEKKIERTVGTVAKGIPEMEAVDLLDRVRKSFSRREDNEDVY